MRVEKTEDYSRWIDGLKDHLGRARVLMRVDRLIHGNPGVHRNLTDGVSELKIDVGPGYRVYYSQRGDGTTRGSRYDQDLDEVAYQDQDQDYGP